MSKQTHTPPISIRPIPSYKLHNPNPITTQYYPDLPKHTSSILQKENSSEFLLTPTSEFHSNLFQRPLYQHSCRALKGSVQPKPLEAFNSRPNTTRNLTDEHGLVTRSRDLSKKSPEVLYKEHLFQTFQAMKFIRTLPQPDIDEIASKALCLSRRPGYEKKKTIIFDLDETLVHCTQSNELGDFSINIKISSNKTIKSGVNIRPHAREVLSSANKDFEVIVFTASHKCYADEVMNYLDPTGELIHHRLYRENCIVKNGVFIKDLRIFMNRRIEDIVIVDNSAYCFAYQLENGVPIISWFDDYNDRELQKLIEYIKILAHVPDLGVVNRRTFHLGSFYDDYTRDFLNQS